MLFMVTVERKRFTSLGRKARLWDRLRLCSPEVDVFASGFKKETETLNTWKVRWMRVVVLKNSPRRDDKIPQNSIYNSKASIISSLEISSLAHELTI